MMAVQGTTYPTNILKPKQQNSDKMARMRDASRGVLPRWLVYMKTRKREEKTDGPLSPCACMKCPKRVEQTKHGTKNIAVCMNTKKTAMRRGGGGGG